MAFHTLEVHDFDVGALQDLLIDALLDTKLKNKELRQTFDQSNPDELLRKLSTIEFNNGRLASYSDLLKQIDPEFSDE